MENSISKRARVFISAALCLFVATLSLFGLAGCGDNAESFELPDEPQIKYSLSDITDVLKIDNLGSVMFSTNFAWLKVNSVGIFNMQGTRIATGSFSSLDYDVIEIEHNGFWDDQQTIRIVKITAYKEKEMILNKYESQPYIIPQVYITCPIDSVAVYEKNG